MSATVTNTGKVAGSDVAQLYLDDPAAAGEPPRQLKGFQKVTLQPGQSTTVRFTLSGQDLSYWNDAANGWVLPDGTFGVYVGDSSALARPAAARQLHGQPHRRGPLRHASAPATVTPGSTANVTATLVNRRRLRDAAGAGSACRPRAAGPPAGRRRSPWRLGRPSPSTSR